MVCELGDTTGGYGGAAFDGRDYSSAKAAPGALYDLLSDGLYSGTCFVRAGFFWSADGQISFCTLRNLKFSCVGGIFDLPKTDGGGRTEKEISFLNTISSAENRQCVPLDALPV